MDNLELLHEKHFPRRLKLRQTINVVFGTHDDALVDANARLKALRSAIERLEGDITTISSFLSEQGVDEDGDLAADERSAEQELIESRSALAQLEAEMACETASADELRSQYDAASASVTRLTAIVRDRTTLVRRLGALRAQYADDLSKLRFAAEAGRLFDPLALATCPSCLQPLAEPAGPSGGTCGLCCQPTDGLDADSAFDVTKEIRTTNTKLQELSRSMDEIDNEVATARTNLIKATDLRDHARTEIDDAVAARLAPFIAQRDIIRDRLTDSQQRISDIARTRALVAGLDSRRVRLTKLRGDKERLQTRINRLRTDGQEGDHVVAALSSRFASILDDFNFPKLEGPRIDSSFTPYVRNMRYSTLGSAGATTLISLAWHLSIFEEAVEQDAQHPGFLMIDSPQKNLMSEEEPDFDGEVIADSVYAHLIEWVSNRGAGQQLILADNAPRPAAEPYIVVRYSGDPERPPYGLIDDEVS